MREMKPLVLPKLVAARKSSKSSFDLPSAEPTSSLYSCTDSGFYSMTDCSSPPTPSRGHLRYPSSTSSLSSSPPTHDPIEYANGSGKLPKLAEEPIEPEDDFEMIESGPASPCLCNNHEVEQHRPTTSRSVISHNYDLSDGFDADSEYASQRMSKRRRSGDSPVNSIATKIGNRIPSISRRLRERKKTSGLGSRSATPSRVPSTRSSSITSSIQQSFNMSEKQLPLTPSMSVEQLEESTPSSPIDIPQPLRLDTEELPDIERFASTPLLPPMMIKCRMDDVPTESPLQSPTVAEPPISIVNTPVGTPQLSILATPPLSSKPSTSSFKAPRPGHLVPSSDIPPIMIADPNDEWSIRLGHANFTIYPEPYVPEICDTTSCKQLFADWEQARRNFTKHQVRTGEHFGVTSKTYILTERKWAEIDSLWKKNHDLAVSRAAEIGHELAPSSPVEPAPLTKMPTLNDPKSEGKFPKLGDEDIVGPMVQIASQIQRRPSRKRAFFRFFSDMKFPGSFLGRSPTGIRATR